MDVCRSQVACYVFSLSWAKPLTPWRSWRVVTFSFSESHLPPARACGVCTNLLPSFRLHLGRYSTGPGTLPLVRDGWSPKMRQATAPVVPGAGRAVSFSPPFFSLFNCKNSRCFLMARLSSMLGRKRQLVAALMRCTCHWREGEK